MSSIRKHFKPKPTEEELEYKREQAVKSNLAEEFYKDVLDSEGGLCFLSEILKDCKVGHPIAYDEDPYRMYFTQGCRSIGEKIIKNIQKHHPELLSKLLKSGNIILT